MTRPTLHPGDHDTPARRDVADLQRALGIAQTGTFDKNTLAFVKAFQLKHQLVDNGIVDERTWNAIEAQRAQHAGHPMWPTHMPSTAPSSPATAASPAHSGHPMWPTHLPSPSVAAAPAHPSSPAKPPVPAASAVPAAAAVAHTPGQYRLHIQETGAEISARGLRMAKGEIILSKPDGTQLHFPFRSGGYAPGHPRPDGKSMMTGLEAPQPSGGDGLNARYVLNWSGLVAHGRIEPAMEGPDGIGGWLGLLNLNGTTSHFGIHTDGPSSPRSDAHYNDGSHGCIAVDTAISKQLFAELSAIPAQQRPRYLEVLPPAAANTLSSAHPSGLTPTASLPSRLGQQVARE